MNLSADNLEHHAADQIGSMPRHHDYVRQGMRNIPVVILKSRKSKLDWATLVRTASAEIDR